VNERRRINPFDPPGYYNGCGRMPPVDPWLRYWDPQPEKEITPVIFHEDEVKPIVVKLPVPPVKLQGYKGLRRAKRD